MNKEYILSTILATMSWTPYAVSKNLSNSHDETVYPTECANIPSFGVSWRSCAEGINDGSYKDDYIVKRTERRRVAVKGYSEKEWESYFKNMEKTAENPERLMATESDFIKAHAGRIVVSI